MLNQIVDFPIALHDDLTCVAYFFSRWRPKSSASNYPKIPVSETEKMLVTLRLVTALLRLGLVEVYCSSAKLASVAMAGVLPAAVALKK